MALGNATHFRNGGEASACFCLMPVQHSSGGKEKMGSVSKVVRNKNLRSALYKDALVIKTITVDIHLFVIQYDFS